MGESGALLLSTRLQSEHTLLFQILSRTLRQGNRILVKDDALCLRGENYSAQGTRSLDFFVSLADLLVDQFVDCQSACGRAVKTNESSLYLVVGQCSRIRVPA